MKSIGRITEEYGGWVTFSIAFLVSSTVAPEKYHFHELLESFPTIGLGIFGFMLTFIAIILQSSNKTIDFMKSQTILFQRFVEYNKRVVYLSAILTLYTYITCNISMTNDYIFKTIVLNNWMKIIAMSLFWGLLSKLCTDTFFFIRSFYILLRH